MQKTTFERGYKSLSVFRIANQDEAPAITDDNFHLIGTSIGRALFYYDDAASTYVALDCHEIHKVIRANKALEQELEDCKKSHQRLEQKLLQLESVVAKMTLVVGGQLSGQLSKPEEKPKAQECPPEKEPTKEPAKTATTKKTRSLTASATSSTSKEETSGTKDAKPKN